MVLQGRQDSAVKKEPVRQHGSGGEYRYIRASAACIKGRISRWKVSQDFSDKINVCIYLSILKKSLLFQLLLKENQQDTKCSLK